MPAGAEAKKRLLFVIGSGFLPGTITGANVSFHALLKRLVAAGFEPMVVCTPDPPNAPAVADARPPGYPVLRVADPVAAMREIIVRLAPGSVVVRGFGLATRAAEVAIALGRRLHVCLPGSFFGDIFPSREAAPLLRYAANSHFLQRVSELHLGCPVALVPSLVEPEDYRCTPGGDTILFVNPTAAKGAHIVAAIVARLPHRRFLLVRSWPEQSNYPHVAFDFPNVEWAPSRLDMRPIYARARMLLMPSILDESWGRTVTEGQISGIPAVVSDRGGLPDNVGPGGIVVPIADPIERWCDAVEGLFADTARYDMLSDLAKRHAARPELAPAQVVARFLEFLAA